MKIQEIKVNEDRFADAPLGGFWWYPADLTIKVDEGSLNDIDNCVTYVP